MAIGPAKRRVEPENPSDARTVLSFFIFLSYNRRLSFPGICLKTNAKKRNICLFALYQPFITHARSTRRACAWAGLFFQPASVPGRNWRVERARTDSCYSGEVRVFFSPSAPLSLSAPPPPSPSLGGEKPPQCSRCRRSLYAVLI